MNPSSVEPKPVSTRNLEPVSEVLLDPLGTEPIRAELLGLERLESHARAVAAACLLAPRGRASSPLLQQFVENKEVLNQVHDRLTANKDQHGIDAEWLIDNFYIIEDSLREVRRDLPAGYDELLPKLSVPPLGGYPRVYALAIELVGHTDSELDETRIARFVRSFQEVAPLTIGELWALPTMLRVVLLENLRRLSEKMIWRWEERRRAEQWAKGAAATFHPRPVPAEDGEPGTESVPAAEPLPAPEPPALADLSDPFVVRLLQLLRDQERDAKTLEHLEDELSQRGFEPNAILKREQSRQAANQVTVGNCVLSLRLLSAVDWNAFFEQSSQVEAILREDPAGIYPRQDFATSDRYRRMVEMVARGSKADEIEVARKVVALAGREHGSNEPVDHVGFYLIDRGQGELKAAFGYQPRWRERLLDAVRGRPEWVYFGSISISLAILIAGVVALALGALTLSWWTIGLAAVTLLPLSEVAVGMVNQVLTLFLPPRVLPKIDAKAGIAVENATFVAIPSMLARPASAAALLERLELHYLANPDPNLRFALLTDFSDAPHETLAADEGLIDDAIGRVRALNRQYGDGGPDIFFLFHRHRQWNEAQGCWMGWERKRGKLLEFNRLLRGARDTSYVVMSADPASLPRIKFVITLDADTQMPRDTAGRLIGTLAHPLNRPRFDPALERVVAGYGVLQPRISFHLTAATHSRFAALLATSGGIDPYSTAASDAYMDLFGEGSFTGKGIYDVDAFEAATESTFPENHILSHDLIEGNYARCGLISDTELFDDFPERYRAYARREHRWVRGDWQLLPWLGLRVPSAKGWRSNPLPLLERWKLLDNLRRSLVPPAIMVLVTLGWTVLPGSPWLWTAVAAATLALPLFQSLLGSVVDSIRGRSFSGLSNWMIGLPAVLGQIFLDLTFLAYRGAFLVDAIIRTLVRMFWTRRKLLEWETAASTERRLKGGLLHVIAGMWMAPAAAVAVGTLISLVRPFALPAAALFLAAWLISPVIAFLISQPRRSVEIELTGAERRALRRIARKTWNFFTTFVGETDHWLPPDNFQEIPDGRIAHRTSPTNTGLLLISTLAAHDLGYISLGMLLDRLEQTFDSFDKLEKHWGHFFNWYDTRTLQPLPPKYLSTVDSGNLLGCLIALKQGLLQKANAPFSCTDVIDGLADTFLLAVEQGGGPSRTLQVLFDERPSDLLAWDLWSVKVEREAVALAGRTTVSESASSGESDESTAWANRLVAEARAWRAELASVAPWIGTIAACDRVADQYWATEPARESWQSIRTELVTPTSVSGWAGRVEGILADLAALEKEATIAEPGAVQPIMAAVRASTAADKLSRLRTLADRAETLAASMDFRPLYREDRSLFAIGFNLTQGKLDNACYDLLASEACLTSYLAVARGEAPRRHWFHLGRHFIRAAGRIGLISWGGTMFEYLMPRLLLRSLPGTILDGACRTAVARQIEYGRELGVPWGVSESAYAAQFPDGDYQYQAFGVPGLGLKQGLEKDHVVAPYATAMATMIAPREALQNLRVLAHEGAEGVYGLYEALDYTRERVPEGERRVVVRSFMAHHQGMSLVALTNTLFLDIMAQRFHAEPMVRAVELLLQERIPNDPPIVQSVLGKGQPDAAALEAADDSVAPLSRRLTSPDTPVPRTNLLSNSAYHVMITNAGAGYSKCRGLDVTRWREDPTRELSGQFCYIRDVQRDLLWSAGYQPVCRPPQGYEVIFAADKASIRRRDADIETLLEVTVSPEQPVEVRRITLTNHDTRPRELEITSYAEVALAAHGEDLAHPAFGKLFLETEWVSGSGALLCRRRPRSDREQPVFAMHVAALEKPASGTTLVGPGQYETDRARFLGRGRTVANPAALDHGATLSGTTGLVLDPVFCLRYRIRLKPGGSAMIALATAVTGSRPDALALADQYRESSAAARVFELAWAHSQVEHRHNDRYGEDSHVFQRLASHVIFAGSALRAERSVLAANRLGQEGLWRFGISGDRPIVMARFENTDQLRVAQELVAAQAYLRTKGLEFDLILQSEEPGGYEEELRKQLVGLVRARGGADRLDQPGGIFVLKAALMQDDEKILIQAAARVVLLGERGSLASQLDRTEWHHPLPGPLAGSRDREKWDDEPVRLPADLIFSNGTGGFTPDGREYCLLVSGHELPHKSGNGQPKPPPVIYPRLAPAPWSNVIANPTFGTMVTESGSGFTWSENSQTNRLTPWSNDPVSDPPGEIVYVRDEESGEIWSPTPLPVPSPDPTLVRHGQGYTTFERNTHGLGHRLTILVSPVDPVKLVRLHIQNFGDRRRKLSTTYYAKWVLGAAREATSMHIVPEVDTETGALLARNAYRADFGTRVAFADVDRRPRTVTADRGEFVGRHGSMMAPAALLREGLSGSGGETFDPCAAIQTVFDLEAGASVEIVFILGEADGAEAARKLIRQYTEGGRTQGVLNDVQSRWNSILETVQVRTPEPALDLLFNRWLLYQVLSCRVWGRSAFYQSGGAFGFRDQLQDVMALFQSAPHESRTHILRAAGRQFPEGDVQHWWHPPAGRGIRTRIADDPLWLPFVTARYVAATGDSAILDESVPYLEGPVLRPDQDDDYGLPGISTESGSLYDHCARALDWAHRRGVHGLPLMEHGDWNDGMNKVGDKGRGESVWLAWFQIACFLEFSVVADARGDKDRATTWREKAETLRVATEKNGWDGNWYRRAYFDDGTPLGSAQNDACQIDSIAQSWGVISRGAGADRARVAMKAVDDRLVRHDDRLILLFAPPFDHTALNPGYIKGYLPGVRENGGQYTHAAAWVVQAAALLGQGQYAFQLLQILNPILHGRDPDEVERYRVEPYVVAGDVYSRSPHAGRGGWTWYTGSAGWFYQATLESMLGFQHVGDRLSFQPCIPPHWSQFEITYRFRTATYVITVENLNGAESGVAAVWLDNTLQAGDSIPLADDNSAHQVRVVVGHS
jgi:cyclic beta-1,2-glucan synthetase